ncbi:eukaryotic translation initiation factor 2-alpha kinase 3-like [Acanthaster planci]|uniref:non-specific serine/threonine protein kinase n=1 Tax=Acanthaster planci TaxID=133434 RepID=A0A8B7Z037_ACAPL|nr:eukaryotic translation initiation factor 2-alpha kinase 3-like [Acanthaster planci]
MSGQATLCRGLVVTAISLLLACGATGSEVQAASTQQQGIPDDGGPKATVYVEGARVAAFNTCSEKTASSNHFRDLMLVSTLDGKVSALDLHNAGSVQWTLDTDIGPLMDASISDFEVIGPDGSYKVIPSLDGGLFRWDGQNVEPVPLSADMLLSSSFKLSDDAVMVGGKETSTYGINAGTGQIVYVCGVSGCHIFEENESTDKDDIIVIERVQRTCRAVEQRTGAEKWNFSVGQHEVSYLPGARNDEDLGSSEYDYDEDYHQATVCVEESEEERAVFKVFISPGTVGAYSEQDPTRLLWKQEFSTAIAAAWTIKEGKLDPIDLFDVKNILLLGPENDREAQPNSQLRPALFMGEYNNQAYVHSSKEVQHFHQAVAGMKAASAAASSKDYATGFPAPKVQWRPYMSTAPSRTPIVVNDQSNHRLGTADSNAITVWSQYPFDVGYYVLQQSPVQFQVYGPKKNPSYSDSNDSGSRGENDGLDILLSVSAVFWWKEILAISLVLALGMQFLCHMLRSSSTLERVNSLSFTGSVSTQESMSEDTGGNADNQPMEYKSRYLTDFEHQQCLGKGGFGIVFEAKNKVDENSYAIKRICLPNRTKARDKVLREARALARLDHGGIVRYFNSWLEEPPAGWQKIQDEQLLGDSVNPSHATLLSQSTTANFNKDSLLVRDKEQFLSQTAFHLKVPPTSQVEMEDFSSGAVDCLTNLNEESGSFSIEFCDDTDGDAEFSLTPKVDESAAFNLGLSSNSDPDLLTPVNAPLCVPFGRSSSLAPVRPRAGQDDSFQVIFESDTSGHVTSAKIGNRDSVGCDNSQVDQLSSPSDYNQNSGSFQVGFESRNRDCRKPETRSADSTGLNDDSVFCHESSAADLDDHTRPRKDDATGKHSRQGSLAGAGNARSCHSAPRVYLYIQMQLCQKETLKDWLGANTLSRDRLRLLHIFQQILAAVQYVHSCGMIHRDLKPSNIFFSVDGTVKVGDFGLVTAVDTQLEPDESLDDDLSSIDLSKKHTSQVGTQLYMSPEQLSGKSYDHKVDIFSLGLIFFELLHPFSTQMERIMVMSGSRQQKFPERFGKELPLETKLIKMLLASNPAERPNADDIPEKDAFLQMYRNFVPPNLPTHRGRYASNSSN